jgi:hypothetical protein
MIFDLKPKDNVFVVGFGYGIVKNVLEDKSFQVLLGATVRQFTPDGRLGGTGAQRVYYHDPMIVNPPKSVHLWNTYKALSIKLFEELSKVID